MLIDFNGIFTRNADKSAHKILVIIADVDDDCHRCFTSLFQIFDFFFLFELLPKLHGIFDDTPDEFLLILKRTTISCNPPSKYKVMLTLSYQFTEGLQKKGRKYSPDDYKSHRFQLKILHINVRVQRADLVNLKLLLHNPLLQSDQINLKSDS